MGEKHPLEQEGCFIIASQLVDDFSGDRHRPSTSTHLTSRVMALCTHATCMPKFGAFLPSKIHLSGGKAGKLRHKPTGACKRLWHSYRHPMKPPHLNCL
jgi:hypothetical protein